MEQKLDLKRVQVTVYPIKIGEFDEVGFLPHSLKQMKRRGITEKDVIQALCQPNTKKVRADFPHKGIVWTKSRTKKLCVIFDENVKQMTVVTAYWKS